MQQKSKSKSKESQLPLKSEGSNEGKGFRGKCDSQASWGCAPALPNRIGEVFLRELFSVTSRRQIKVFRCSSFSKMLPRCGQVAHICEANYFCNLFSLLQLHFLKLSNSQLREFYETSYKFEQGNGAIAACW